MVKSAHVFQLFNKNLEKDPGGEFCLGKGTRGKTMHQIFYGTIDVKRKNSQLLYRVCIYPCNRRLEQSAPLPHYHMLSPSVPIVYNQKVTVKKFPSRGIYKTPPPRSKTLFLLSHNYPTMPNNMSQRPEKSLQFLLRGESCASSYTEVSAY